TLLACVTGMNTKGPFGEVPNLHGGGQISQPPPEHVGAGFVAARGPPPTPQRRPPPHRLPQRGGSLAELGGQDCLLTFRKPLLDRRFRRGARLVPQEKEAHGYHEAERQRV